MATIQNYRDTTLQATSPRAVKLDSDYIRLDSNYQYFKIDTAGVATPSTINITATLVGNIAGTVVFTVESGTATINTSGNSCSIPYASMSTDSITIKASLTYLTLVYETRYTITKVKDGAPGISPTVNAIELSNPVIAKSAPDAATTGNYTSITIQGKKYLGTTPTNFGWITITPNNGTESARVDTASTAYTLAPTSTSGVSSYIIKLYDAATAGNLVDTQTVSVVFNGSAGSPGTNGTRTAILEMYQWAATAPTTYPSGTSTYTWSTGQFTAPATANSWTLVPGTPTAGQTLWVVRQVYADTATTATTAITWNATSSVSSGAAGTNGSPGANGQRVGVLEVYQWAATAPTTYPSGTSTYTWATGAFTAPTTANNWSLTPGAAIAGQTLWAISVSVSDNLTTATSTATWNSNSVYAIGAAGTNGSAAKYCTLGIDSQAITYDTNGNTPSPTTTTLTATAYNCTSPNYEFIIGGTQVQNGTTATYTYTVPTTYTSMPKQVVVNIRENSTTGTIVASDTLSIIGIKPGLVGSNGIDAIQVILSNETQALPAGNNGTVSSYSNSGTDIKVYQGTTLLDYDGIGTGTGKWTISNKISTNITPGTTTSIGTSPNRYASIGVHSGVSASTDTSSIVYTISGVTSTGASFSIDKTQTFSKVRAGTDAIVAVLSNESHVFPADSGGNVSNYTNSGTTIYVYEGTTALVYDALGTSSSRWKVTASGTNITPGTITDSGDYVTVGVHSGVAAGTDTSLITYTINGKNSNNVAFTLTVTQSFTKSKAGPDGGRGSVTGYGSKYVSSSSWTDGAANATIYNIINGTTLTTLASTTHLRIGDTVTLSNGTTFSATKYWSGTAWVAPGTVIDGNLLVTGTLSSDAINATGIVAKNYKTSTGTTRVEIDSATNALNILRSGTTVATLGGTLGNAFNMTATASGGEMKITSSSSYYSIYLTSTYASASNLGQLYISSTGGQRGISVTTVSNNAIYASSTQSQAILATADTNEPIRATATLAAGATANNNHALRAWNQNRGVSGMVGTTTGYDFYAEGASGVNYGPFTGAHDIFFETDDIELGDIIVDTRCILKGGISNTLFIGTKSTESNQRGVVGVLSLKRQERFSNMQVHPAVFQTTLDPIVDDYGNTISKFANEFNECMEQNYYYYSMNALGEGLVNVCGENGNINKGDLIVSSSMPGKGMKQSDDIIRSYTVAKAREDIVFEYPEQVIQIACIYLCG